MKSAPNLESPETTFTVKNHSRQWPQVMRPLAWWLLLVLLLFAYQKHVQWRERTRAKFSVLLEGRNIAYQTTATVEGNQIPNNGRIPLFQTIQLIISHPKYESFSTNFFVGYGEHDLGTINLKRSKGTLVIKATVPASLITIEGPEFSLSLTNSSGTTTSLPTDRYVVKASYPRWQKQEEVTIYPSQSESLEFEPQIGDLQLISNEKASFKLYQKNGRIIEAGDFPFKILGLPEGEYELVSQYHGHEQQRFVRVNSGITNDVTVGFIYGAATFETTPSHVSVIAENGRDMGFTPLTLSELEPGTHKFKLRREGFATLLTSLEIVGNQTNTIQTNLVNMAYSGAIKIANDALTAKDYSRAFDSANDALLAQPNDPDAESIKKEATMLLQLNDARELASKGDFEGSIRLLESILAAFPENKTAKELLVEYKVPAQKVALEREVALENKNRAERQRLLISALNEQSKIFAGGEYFKEQKLTTKKELRNLGLAIRKIAKDKFPQLEMDELSWKTPDVFVTRIKEVSPKIIRFCLIAAGKDTNAKTDILFKVLEFQSNKPGDPVLSSVVMKLSEEQRKRVEAGQKLFTELLEQAARE